MAKMITVEQIVKFVSSLNLPLNKYCVVGGGMMKLWGLRECTNNLDILVMGTDAEYTSCFPDGSNDSFWQTIAKHVPNSGYRMQTKIVHVNTFPIMGEASRERQFSMICHGVNSMSLSREVPE